MLKVEIWKQIGLKCNMNKDFHIIHIYVDSFLGSILNPSELST